MLPSVLAASRNEYLSYRLTTNFMAKIFARPAPIGCQANCHQSLAQATDHKDLTIIDLANQKRIYGAPRQPTKLHKLAEYDPALASGLRVERDAYITLGRIAHTV